MMLQLISCVLVCVTILISLVPGVFCAKGMFAICDKDDNDRITKEELAVCMNMMPELNSFESNTQAKIVQLMNLIDKNNDGYISAQEFQKATDKAQKAFDSDEFIHVTKADGSVQKVHKSEMFNPMTGPVNGVEMKNDKLYKEESETGNVGELSKKNPSLGNMVRIGQWTASQLKALNLTDGSLLKLESLPNGGSVVDKNRIAKEPELLGVVFNGEFEVWIKLKMSGGSGGVEGEAKFFEAHVEYNKKKYRTPHLAILEAWVLQRLPGTNSEQRVELIDLPNPSVKKRFSLWMYDEFEQYARYPYAAIIAALLFGLFILSIFI